MSFMGDGRLRSIIVHLDNYLLCLRTAIDKFKDLLIACVQLVWLNLGKLPWECGSYATVSCGHAIRGGGGARGGAVQPRRPRGDPH